MAMGWGGMFRVFGLLRHFYFILFKICFILNIG